MRLVFFYYSYKHGYGQGQAWDPCAESNNYYAARFTQEGYYRLIQYMADLRIIDEALVVIESRESPGYRVYSEKVHCLVMPDITALTGLIKAGNDVIWVRGGFKHWHDWLFDLHKQGFWLMIYAANTGRQKWKFWDVVFNDLDGKDHVDGIGRVHLDFRKPINDEIFYLNPVRDRWDVMIGASRVHDKKGQWRAIDALATYKELYKEPLRAVVPGPFSRGVQTNRIREKVLFHNLPVDILGEVPREDLAVVMNSTKIFVGLGSHGQGDRGPMEAMACGCPLLIGYPWYHAPWVTADERYAAVSENPDNPIVVATEINKMLSEYTPALRQEVSRYREECAGIERHALPLMARLFSWFKENPRANRKALAKELGL